MTMTSATATAISRSLAVIGNTNAKIQVHATIQSMRATRRALSPSTSVGFVPTMGALHEGHLTLIRKAREKNDIVISSIFVNPTQFGKGEDLDKYPRQLEKDAMLLENAGVDHIFAPSNDEMYGENHLTFVDPMGFDGTSEGRSRPGHFRGVATVVTKLFNIIQPTRAYFGQKDAAQCCVIRRLVDDLHIPVDIVIVDTIRECDGLALSSRNAYLTTEERASAPVLYRALCKAREKYERSISSFSSHCKIISADVLIQSVRRELSMEPLVSQIDYVSVDDRQTMRPLVVVDEKGAIISLACRIGAVRLIDNILLRSKV